MHEKRLTGIETRLSLLENKVDSLDKKVDSLDKKVDGLDKKVDELGESLGRQMRVLHEDTIDKIKALAPDFAPVRREFHAADAKLRREIEGRLIPLEEAVRNRPK